MNEKIKQLQEAVLDELLEQVTKGPTALNDAGETVRLSPSPAVLKVALDAVKTFKDDVGLPQTGELSAKLQKYATRAPALVAGNALTN